jgi:ATP-dependent DNA helicase RecG
MEYARVKCARFKGSDTDEFIDQKVFDGPLYLQVEKTINFAKTYIAKAGKVKNGLQRRDHYEMPLLAICEAIVNAVVHRDYSLSGSDIKFAIFDDQIEITYPGVLPKTLDIHDITIGRSEIRNRVIARFFNEIGFIEQRGTGIQKIITSCLDSGLEQPKFIESGYFFKVIISKRPSQQRKRSDKINIGSVGVAKSGDKVATSSDKLTESERIIVDYLESHDSVTNKVARDVTGLSSSGARKSLSKLTAKNLIEPIGERKNRLYRLKG